jgi:predicted house-cleaning noncanonical NTP pyrophosphatase (MazG superfamily)
MALFVFRIRRARYNGGMNYTHTGTNLDVENEYPKLIRDRIPEIIEANGQKAIIEMLDDAGYEQYLRKKLLEEAAELADAKTDEHLGEEAADLLEVAEALLKLHGYADIAAIEPIRKQKNEVRGAFTKRLLMRGFEK